jgi:hypothetical protein
MIKHTWKSFKRLTNRGKCLYMWRWLRDNPNMDKKDFFLINFGLDVMQNDMDYAVVDTEDTSCCCFAFNEAGESCENCPVIWVKGRVSSWCEEDGSTYQIWADMREQDIKVSKEVAQAVLDTIINTWKV